MDDADTDIAAAVGRTWTDDRPWEFLTDLTAIGSRMAASPGEERASELVADAFDEAGLRDVHREPFETNEWRRGSADLDLLAPVERSFETIALPYCPPGDVRGELVDVGYGTPEEVDDADVEGKIAVASTTTPEGGRFVHRMEKFGYAAEAGAVGFVFVNHVPGQLPPTGSLTFDREATIPAVGVSKETGAWLTEYADRGDSEARLRVDAETVTGESRNVLARVGPDSDREVFALAHYDAHDIAEGALDNGCGVATLVTAARILAETEDDLDIGVRFAAVGCEETGLAGAERLAATTETNDVKCVLNLDGAGRFRDLVALTHTSEATEEVVRRVGEAANQPVRVKSEPHPFSDQWPFVRAGVPALQLHSDSGERGRGWGHTHADTRDKVDDRNVREHGILAAFALREMADRATEMPTLDAYEVEEAFREADYETGMRAAGLWPTAWE
ncbi:M28 family peptidase [Candidatus Halobonum tyrrellensis]|uniref:Carboxypeptidase Q n=1 Tax=Candidatus Halobonum tyrrellensis G22 TaxID=1324957 RepID=V4GQN4_9EURY|nr:M28 family metallopeptidase [Candidatus Halobonum tyrrellensis]ESP87341.1 peptidase M28 [Candidatus Halobonum tyrrellensis G22]